MYVGGKSPESDLAEWGVTGEAPHFTANQFPGGLGRRILLLDFKISYVLLKVNDITPSLLRPQIVVSIKGTMNPVLL